MFQLPKKKESLLPLQLKKENPGRFQLQSMAGPAPLLELKKETQKRKYKRKEKKPKKEHKKEKEITQKIK